MIINNFSAKKVYGYLDFNIDFKDEINFLVGLNGCGKTTALKLVAYLLTPDFSELSQIPFEFCRLKFTLHKNDGDSFIEVRKGDKSIKITSSLFQGELTHKQDDLNDTDESYKLKLETIQKLTKPVLISLDRKFSDFKYQIDDDFQTKKWKIIENGTIKEYQTIDHSQSKDSLSYVRTLIKNEIRGIERKNLIENEKLKDKILLDSFTVVNATDAIKLDDKLTENEIEIKKDLILNAISSLNLRDKNLKNIITATINFFEELKKNATIITNHKYEEKIKKNNVFINAKTEDPEEKAHFNALMFLIANQPQIYRINNLVEFIKKSQQEKLKAYEKIDLFESIVNSFFSQTGKRISIRTGNLKISVNNNDNLDVNSLSSGETQILALFAHMIFNKRLLSRATLMIDEPELSLHLAWQEMFVESLKKANPDLQIVLATHSPAIINGNDNFCVFVNPIKKS